VSLNRIAWVVLAFILAGLMTWSGSALLRHDRALASQEAQLDAFKGWLGRVENKLDRVLWPDGGVLGRPSRPE